MTLEAEFREARVIGGARAGRPQELAVGGGDVDVVNGGFAAAHKAEFGELPLLVAVGSKPVRGGVVPLVLEADGDVVAGKGPELLDEAVAVLGGPLAGEEVHDGGTTGEKLRTIAPSAVLGVSKRDANGVAGVPGVLGEADFLKGGLVGEGRERRPVLHSLD